MKDISFNKGIDFWYAHYYENLHFSFRKQEAIDAFGDFFSVKLNEIRVKEELCKEIGEILVEYFRNFKEINISEFISGCFNASPVIYSKQFQYIKFPDFIDDKAQDFLFRIDINPCIGKKATMTKIYCIPRYRSNLSQTEAIEFFRRSNLICERIVRLLLKIYVETFNEFVDKNPHHEMHMINKDQISDPYVLISRVAGTTEDFVQNFINLLDWPEKWAEFCRNDQRTKKIFNFLSEMNKTVEKGWGLSDYGWSHHRALYQRNGNDQKDIHEAAGYMGFNGDRTFCHIIGITDSHPRDILLPLHIDIIQSN